MNVWRHVWPPLAGLFLFPLRLACIVLVPLVLVFARWDKAPTTDRTGWTTIRGDLPSWLSWFSTPDERLPGGLYEPTVEAMLRRRGRFITSWYWLGARNQLHGLGMWLGMQTTDYAPESDGYWSRGEVWRRTWTIGVVRVIVGWQVYKLLDGRFWAYPALTVKWAS
jgi:hypothetical protein